MDNEKVIISPPKTSNLIFNLMVYFFHLAINRFTDSGRCFRSVIVKVEKRWIKTVASKMSVFKQSIDIEKLMLRIVKNKKINSGFLKAFLEDSLKTHGRICKYYCQVTKTCHQLFRMFWHFSQEIKLFTGSSQIKSKKSSFD